MKKILILAIAVAGAFTMVRADEVFLSPKAKEFQDSLKRVPGITPEMIDRSIQPGTPKSREQAASMRRVPSTGPNIDLAHAPRPNLPAKDPRYEMALQGNAVREFQVAPLK